MTIELCRCGPHPTECRCNPDPAMLEWSAQRAFEHGANVVALEPYRYRQRWNRHVRETWGGDDHAA